MKVELVSKTEFLNGETFAEAITRVATHGKGSSMPKGRLLKYLWEHKHLSPFSFIHFNFKIETSRFVSAQLFRHGNHNGKQEFSQRYSEVPSVEPMEFRYEHEKNHQSSVGFVGVVKKTLSQGVTKFRHMFGKENTPAEREWLFSVGHLMNEYEKVYARGVELGVARETLRQFSPMASTTIIHMDLCLRDWLVLLNVRLDHHTQKECRDVAIEVAKQIALEFPEIAEMTNNFNDYKGMFL